MFIKEVDSKTIQNTIHNAVYTISRTLDIDTRKATKLFYSTKTSDQLLNPLTGMSQENYDCIAKLAIKEITNVHKEMFAVKKVEASRRYLFGKAAFV